jgi:hypothetical protein
MIRNSPSAKIHSELLFALESARTRLAVAIAAETKSTSMEQWQYYLDTADRICRLARKLRTIGFAGSYRMNAGIRAVHALRQISNYEKALPICRTLEAIAVELE